ncbi:hypothetical protein Q2389_26385, partial [Escherichia coli]|nr:hypothetical protein [Escherichia coli]
LRREKNWQTAAPEAFFYMPVGKIAGVWGKETREALTQGCGWEFLVRYAFQAHEVSGCFF